MDVRQFDNVAEFHEVEQRQPRVFGVGEMFGGHQASPFVAVAFAVEVQMGDADLLVVGVSVLRAEVESGQDCGLSGAGPSLRLG